MHTSFETHDPLLLSFCQNQLVYNSVPENLPAQDLEPAQPVLVNSHIPNPSGNANLHLVLPSNLHVTPVDVLLGIVRSYDSPLGQNHDHEPL